MQGSNVVQPVKLPQVTRQNVCKLLAWPGDDADQYGCISHEPF